MRTKTIFPGLSNNQKIRIMVDGFGMYMRVKDIDNICTTKHRSAVNAAVFALGANIKSGQKITGFGTGLTVYNEKLESVRVDVQVDLVTD